MGRGSKHGINRDEWEQRRTEFCDRGTDLPHTKLTHDDIHAIRSAKRQREGLVKHIRENLSNAALARKFGVHERSIEKIVSRETWCHLP